MNAQDILTALMLGEEKDWEFKGAKGGLPGSLWETYSAMANTDGGVIVLGVKQHNDSFIVEGVPEPPKMKQDFWNVANNKQKISQNLLANDDVTIETLEGNPVIAIRIPRATRRQRPVYVGQNPLEGTYRRYQEGDYKCTRNEVGRMLADQADEPADCLIVENFGLDDLDPQSLQQYRNRFSARSPTHPWLAYDEKGLLEKLGGWRKDRQTGIEGLTVAGLLMFGKDEAIRDPTALPQYHVDYRERLSDDPEVRWTDRLTIDGTWVGNLFQFYQRVIGRLFADLKVPFQMGPDLFRKDETLVHEAIREALVNALIHPDYRGMGGVVIEKYRDRLEMSNPGSLLLSIEQMLKGGVSECRNKSLQLMFQQIGGGEKAGSGIDKIRQGWASQRWRWPLIGEQYHPDRVIIVLPMVSLLPEESLAMLRRLLGDGLAGLGPEEVQALVTADVEGEVSNFRLQQFSNRHVTEITKTLQGLCIRGLLEKDGHGRWASYRLSDKLREEDSEHRVAASTQTGEAPHNAEAGSTQIETDPALLTVAQPARDKKRLPSEQMDQIVLELCMGQFLTPRQLGVLLQRNHIGLQQHYLRRLVKKEKLRLRFPDDPTHPDQAYTNSQGPGKP